MSRRPEDRLSPEGARLVRVAAILGGMFTMLYVAVALVWIAAGVR